MNRKVKQFLKFVLKPSYREQVYRRELEGTIARLQSPANPTKKIRIIMRDNTEVGVFSDYIVFLRMIAEAYETGYIPIIDRQTVKCAFLPAAESDNTWEFFFEQPSGISLGDITEDMEVNLARLGGGTMPVQLMDCEDPQITEYWRGRARKYIRFTRELQEHLDAKYAELIRGRRVLGCSVREGYQKMFEQKDGTVWGHPRQATVEELIQTVSAAMTEWNCDYVFVTCQTTDTVQKFRDAFGDKVLCVDRKRVDYENLVDGKKLPGSKKPDEAYANEKDYITEIYLLSKCTSFICSKNSGSDAAFLMSEGFENFRCLSADVY